jgi:formyltetrahydrofolate-dependent phosphoribosylglycinamide formyltransferase
MPSSSGEPLRLAVLISGGGTTLKNLLEKIAAGELDAQIELVISSDPQAGGLKYAAEAEIPHEIVRRGDFDSIVDFSRVIFDHCRQCNVQLVVMGGFLKQVEIPPDFENRVTNIHPGLIPSFCGQGFYGSRVHQAVLDYGCKISGCTVHFVDNEYDHGPIIRQHVVEVLEDDTVETLAARVFLAEREAYPQALQDYARGRITVEGRHVRITER